MKLPTKTIEKNLFSQGYHTVIGVDEVGMGCLAGPVVVCAIVFTRPFYHKTNKKLHWLRDSKLLQPKQREFFFDQLMQEKDIKFRISYCYPKTIDSLNIYQAARLAMKRAILRLVNSKSDPPAGGRNPTEIPGYAREPSPSKQIQKFKNSENSNLDIVSKFVLRASDFKTVVLVDGPHKIAGLNMEQMPIVKGDRKVFAISCASVIAKVFRDRMMVRYARKFPGYGFEKHKGYSTKLHKAQLSVLGPSPIHRHSFGPVNKFL